MATRPQRPPIPEPEPDNRLDDSNAIVGRMMHDASMWHVDTRRQEQTWWRRIHNAVSHTYRDGIAVAVWEAKARQHAKLFPRSLDETAP